MPEELLAWKKYVIMFLTQAVVTNPSYQQVTAEMLSFEQLPRAASKSTARPAQFMM